MRKKSGGQSISEYTLIVGIVAVAIIGMQVYMKRGIQAVIRVAADEVGSQEDAMEDVEKGDLQNSTFDTAVVAESRLITSEGGAQAKVFDVTTDSSGNSTYESKEEE